VKTILVLDDDKNVREYLRRILERKGYEVLDASNGEDGIALFRRATVDLVIIDMLMPRMDGAETMLHLRSAPNSPKIIAISGGSAELDAGVCLKVGELAGASLTFDKPIDGNSLVTAVRQLLDGER